MARLVKALRMRQVFPPFPFRLNGSAATGGELENSADLANKVIASGTDFTGKVVTMETYYKGWLKFITVSITLGVFSTTVNQYMTNKQINGLESHIEGLECKIEGVSKIQVAHETLLKDIRREIQELKQDSNAKFAELKSVLEKAT